MPVTEPGVLSLPVAIADLETAIQNLSNADVSLAAAQQRYDTADAAKRLAEVAHVETVAAFNATLDDLIAAATAAKR